MPKALESEIADIWKEILGVQHVAPEHDFNQLRPTYQKMLDSFQMQ